MVLAFIPIQFGVLYDRLCTKWFRHSLDPSHCLSLEKNLNYIFQMITAILLVTTEIRNNIKHLQQEKNGSYKNKSAFISMDRAQELTERKRKFTERRGTCVAAFVPLPIYTVYLLYGEHQVILYPALLKLSVITDMA